MGAQQVRAQESIRFGDDFELQVSPRRLRCGTRVLKLERIPLEILFLLVERRGEIVTREEIVPRIWGPGVFLDTDNSIRGAIRKIRQVLKDDPEQPQFIQTITGQGYRFIAPVTSASSPIQASAPATIPEIEQPAETVAPKSVSGLHRWTLAFSICAILALAAYGVYRHRTPGNAKPKIKSIAVLPLRNLSGDPSQEYLADGLTDELIGRLSSIRDLRVTSHTSVMRYKDPKQSVPEIAKELRVDAVVEGSVIREGDHIRVIAQLVRGDTDEHFWSESYNRELRDVLSLESDVAQAIARKVEVTVTGEEHVRLLASRHVAPEVYESYLKGRTSKNDSKAQVEQRIRYFEEAVAKDPTFAPAYVGLADSYESLSSIFIGGPPQAMRQKAVQAARKALELDPDNAEAHSLLGSVYQEQWRWAEAEAEYKRALALNPNNAAAHGGYALWLACEGRHEEAVRWAQRGRELDPLVVSGDELGWIYFLGRHYDEAQREFQEVLAVTSNDTAALWGLGFVLIIKEQPNNAVLVLEKDVQLTDRGPGVVALLATAYARAGQRQHALKLVEELERRGEKHFVPAGAFINPYMGLADYDQAFVWFERAYREQSPILQFLKVHPQFDPIRKDPRFLNLLERVGLQS